MAQMTAVQLGTVLFITCLTAQMVSQVSSQNTTMTMGNQTMRPNINSTMATSTYSGPMNVTTAPAGGAHQSRATLFVLISGAMTTIMLQRFC